jgi:hypothetical protein
MYHLLLGMKIIQIQMLSTTIYQMLSIFAITNRAAIKFFVHIFLVYLFNIFSRTHILEDNCWAEACALSLCKVIAPPWTSVIGVLESLRTFGSTSTVRLLSVCQSGWHVKYPPVVVLISYCYGNKLSQT